MCLAIPMKLIRLRDDGTGVGDIDGTLHDVDLSLIESPAIDDYLIVHAGFAIERLDEDEANKRLQLFEDLAAQS
jgi:hydrogenase expression/formation protein HypC